MSGERIVPEKIRSLEEYFLYLKGLFLYDWCKAMVPQGGICVDIGCGDGYGTRALSKFGVKVVGVDIDKKAVKCARKKYGTSDIEFKEYSGVRLPFEDNSVDVVAAMHVIEHIHDDGGLVKDVYRILKPGGKFICVTPNKSLRLPGGMAPWNVYHLREYNEKELEGLFSPVFKSTQLYGVTAVEEAMQIEKKRITENIKVAKADRFDLRKKLPVVLTGFAAAVYHWVKNINRPQFNIASVTLDNVYFITPLSEGEALDLIGVCQK